VPEDLAHDRFKEPFSQRIYLPDGTTSDITTGPDTPNWTPLDQISPYMQIAVLTTEDGAFPRHHGFNHAAIRASIIANLEARRFVRGASTITMQLAKNLFLSRDKTLARKIQEVVLTDYLEQAFSKDEIMELYFNVIEFGPSVYGITQAAEYYFGRAPSELNVAECYFLASLLPSPLRYGAMRDGEQVSDSWMKLLKGLMQVAHKRGLVSDADLTEGLTEVVTFWHGGVRPQPRPPVKLRIPIEGDDQGTPAMIDGAQDGP
jgi:membrane peptidoglycan carboxypeptidase